jgi:hypothetical protein
MFEWSAVMTSFISRKAFLIGTSCLNPGAEMGIKWICPIKPLGMSPSTNRLKVKPELTKGKDALLDW